MYVPSLPIPYLGQTVMTPQDIRAALAKTTTTLLKDTEPKLYIKRWPLQFYFLIAAELEKPADARNMRSLQAEAIYRGVCTEAGELIFTPEKTADGSVSFPLEGLADLSGPVAEQAYDEMLALNGFVKQDSVKDAGNAKNLPTTGNSAS